MTFNLSTSPMDWLLSAFDSTFGCVLLFSLGMGLGVCSLTDFYFGFDAIWEILSWPLFLIIAIFQVWGLLIAAALGVIFWGLLFDVWSKPALFAWTMLLGALTRLIVHWHGYDAVFGWPTALLLIPTLLLFYTCGPVIQRKIWRRQALKSFELDAEPLHLEKAMQQEFQQSGFNRLADETDVEEALRDPARPLPPLAAGE